ncbi:uncharacterized protein [Periplaneta americana]|uniref:uncharacterized protein n=1 Tax=Periplaneta americana TaxID=6978 RepID=UPI0037E8F70C
MKLDLTVLVILEVTAMAVSFCPKCVFSLRDKVYKYNRPHNQLPIPAALINVVGRQQDNTPHVRNARCLGLLDWLFEELEPEPDTTTTTTTTTTTSTTTATTGTTSPSTQPTSATPVGTTAGIAGGDSITTASGTTTETTTTTTAAPKP